MTSFFYLLSISSGIFQNARIFTSSLLASTNFSTWRSSHHTPHILTFLSLLLESDLEVCGLVASSEDSGWPMEAEALLWFPAIALLMCSTCKVWPCMQQPFSSLTAVSAYWGPLVITMATLENTASETGSCCTDINVSIWETNCCFDIRTCCCSCMKGLN